VGAREDRRGRSYAAAIYGSILVTTLVSALSEEHAHAGDMAMAVLASVIVFWLAHAWSEVIGERVVEPRPITVGGLVRNAAEDWPMVESAVVPLLALLLAQLGVWSLTVGVDVALAAGVLQLVGWGMLVGLRTFARWPHALLAGLVDGALGLAIVALKLLVEH
jgi:hypothetical protein